MKAKPYFFTYLFSLAIGVLLLIFTGRTNLFYWMVVAIGALFILPSAGAIIDALIPKRGAHGEKKPKPWYLTILGVAGLVFGVILICLPGFFASYIVYTLGVVLILFGLAQLVFMSVSASAFGINRWFYVMPWLTLIAGIAVIFLGPKGIENIVTVITGICLIVYAINGFMQMGAAKSREKISPRTEIQN